VAWRNVWAGSAVAAQTFVLVQDQDAHGDELPTTVA